MIYIGYTSPFTLPWMNRLEKANEFLILVATYFLIIYSNGFLLKEDPRLVDIQMKDWEAQEFQGWFHVGHLGILVTLNMTVMLVVQITSIIRLVKLSYSKMLHRKKLKEL